MSMDLENQEEKLYWKRGRKIIFWVIFLGIIACICVYAIPIWKDAKYISEHLNPGRISVNGQVQLTEESIKDERIRAFQDILIFMGASEEQVRSIRFHGECEWNQTRYAFSPGFDKDNLWMEIYVSRNNQVVNASAFLRRMGLGYLSPGLNDQYVSAELLNQSLGVDVSAASALNIKDMHEYGPAAYFILLLFADHNEDTYSYSLDGIDISLSLLSDEEYTDDKMIEIHVTSDDPELAVETLAEKLQKIHVSFDPKEVPVDMLEGFDLTIEPFEGLFMAPTEWDNAEIAGLLKVIEVFRQ